LTFLFVVVWLFHWYIVYMLPVGINAAVSLEGEKLESLHI